MSERKRLEGGASEKDDLLNELLEPIQASVVNRRCHLEDQLLPSYKHK